MKHKNALSKVEIWQKRISEWRKSGLTQKSYCRKKGLSLATFRFWKHRISEPACQKFVNLPLDRTNTGKRLQLILPGGEKIILSKNSSLPAVTAILETLCASTGAK